MALVQKQFGDLITFTRASAGGRFNAAGVFEMVPANQPRFDFNPATKKPLGLLIEESRTNFVNHSQLGASPSSSGVTIASTGIIGTGLERGAVFPEGPAPATRWAYSQSFVPAPNETYSLSIFIRYSDGGAPVFGAPANSNSALNAFTLVLDGQAQLPRDYTISDLGAGLYRIRVTGRSQEVAIIRGWGVLQYPGQGANSKEMVATGYQVEKGIFATSYIPTNGTQATRAADVARVNVLSPWFNPAEGTLYVEVEPAFLDINNWYAALTDGTLNNAIDIGTAAGGRSRSRVLVGGATEASVSSIDQLTKISKIATAYRKGLVVNATNGKVRSAMLANLPTSISTLGIGMIATFQYSPGLIRSIRYYPRSLTDSELQALTT